MSKVRRWMKETDGKQPNDPQKLARAMVTLASSGEPPLRFTAGADAVQAFEESLTQRRAELERWRTTLGVARIRPLKLTSTEGERS